MFAVLTFPGASPSRGVAPHVRGNLPSRAPRLPGESPRMSAVLTFPGASPFRGVAPTGLNLCSQGQRPWTRTPPTHPALKGRNLHNRYLAGTCPGSIPTQRWYCCAGLRQCYVTFPTDSGHRMGGCDDAQDGLRVRRRVAARTLGLISAGDNPLSGRRHSLDRVPGSQRRQRGVRTCLPNMHGRKCSGIWCLRDQATG